MFSLQLNWDRFLGINEKPLRVTCFKVKSLFCGNTLTNNKIIITEIVLNDFINPPKNIDYKIRLY